VTELRHAVRDLGMRAPYCPRRPGSARHSGHRDFDPLYEEPNARRGARGPRRGPAGGSASTSSTPSSRPTRSSTPFAILVQFTSLMFDGVFERIPPATGRVPRVRAGWVPYMMDRMDDEFESGASGGARSSAEAERVRREGNIYFLVRGRGADAALVIRASGRGPDLLCLGLPTRAGPSRLPARHPGFVERTDLSDKVKRRSCCTTREFYRLD